MQKFYLNILAALGFAIILVIIGQSLTGSFPNNAPPPPPPPDGTDGTARKLIIVGEPWPPFEYPEDKQLKGLNIEVLEQIMADLDVAWEIQFYPWSRAWHMATTGQADAVISISYKPAREEFLIYTESQKQFDQTGVWPEEYLWPSEYVFFCRAILRDSFTFTSYDQIKKDGYRIITIQDYSYNPEFRDAGFQTIMVPTQEEGFQMLVAGQADILPIDKIVGRATIAKLGLEDSISSLPRPLFRKPYLLPFCKKSNYPGKQELMQTIYARLNEMRASGEYEAIQKKYLPN